MISLILTVSLLTIAADNEGAAMTKTETAHTLPMKITSFGAATQDGWLYVAGGHTGKAHDYSKADFHNGMSRIRLDGGTEWEKLPGSIPLQSVALVSDGRRLIRIGGMTALNEAGESHDLHSVDTVEAYEPDARKWVALPSLPVPRSSHDAVIDGRRIYVAGGWTLEGNSKEAVWLSTPLMLDLDYPTEWKALPDEPLTRRAVGVAVLDGKLYVLGGMDEYSSMLKDVEILDLEKGTWSEGPKLPFKGFGASAFTVGGRLYANGMDSAVYRLSDDGESWVAVAELSSPRFFHRLVPAGNDKLLFIGGVCNKGFLDSIELLRLPGARP